MVDKYKHDCIEWDYLTIDSNSPELHCCSCYNDDEFKFLRDIQRRIMDRINDALSSPEAEQGHISELTANIAHTFTKPEIIHRGIRGMLEASAFQLTSRLEENFAQLISNNLQDINNYYQFTFTIKKLAAAEEEPSTD